MDEIKELIKEHGFGQLSAKYRSEKSYNGYSLDVLKSALQKYIRRCVPDMAIYAAAELDMFSFVPEGERIRSNFIHRLMIIFMEDVYNPSLWTLMDTLIFKLLDLRNERKGKDLSHPLFCEKRREEIDAVCRIVYSLATSPHSRENSYYRYCLSIYLTNDNFMTRNVETHFPWITNLKEKKEKKIEPENIPSFLNKVSIEHTHKQLIKNFIGSLEKRDDICFYYAHLLAGLKESPMKFYNSKKPAYMIFYLIDFVLENEGHPYRYMVNIGKKWYKELNPIKEDFLCWQTILLFLVKEKYNNNEEYKEKPIVQKLYKLYQRNIREEKIQFDDWVYDMHTRVGKTMGKGSEHFAKESSFVCNEVKHINKLYKDVYTYSKVLQEKKEDINEKDEKDEKDEKVKEKDDTDEKTDSQTDIRKYMKKRDIMPEKKIKSVKPLPTFEQSDIRNFMKKKSNAKSDKSDNDTMKSILKSKHIVVEEKPLESDLESEFSNFVIRAQLVTGNSKTDTYYGEKNGKLVFIKGPIDISSVEPFMKLQNIKESLGLPTLNYRIVMLKPDLFGETPLGRRNSLDKSKIHPFIVSDVLFEHSSKDIPYRWHSSKLWPETKLVDFDKIKGMEHLQPFHLKNEKVRKEYAETIIFRYIFGLGDLASRNFIVKDNHIYSIDEDIIDKDFNLENNLNRSKATYEELKKEIRKNKEYYLNYLNKYKKIHLTKGGERRVKEIEQFINKL